MISRLLADLIYSVRPRRKPDFLIGPSRDDPYMRRWWIIPRNNWFNIYLHHMRHDDDDRAPHDHPWWSLSLCLRGFIREHRMVIEEQGRIWYINGFERGDWVFRGTNYIHRLALPRGDAWTLFITGPKVRVWGFWCPRGFKPWQEFVDSDQPGQPGRGCGELE